MYKTWYVTTLILFLMLTGCAMQKKIKPTHYEHYQEIIAKFADLPDAPFQAELESIAISDQSHEQVQIFYTGNLSICDMKDFYQQQMERLGWELFAQSDIQDCILYYTKPEQLCSILIKERFLSIYYCNKRGA